MNAKLLQCTLEEVNERIDKLEKKQDEQSEFNTAISDILEEVDGRISKLEADNDPEKTKFIDLAINGHTEQIAFLKGVIDGNAEKIKEIEGLQIDCVRLINDNWRKLTESINAVDIANGATRGELRDMKACIDLLQSELNTILEPEPKKPSLWQRFKAWWMRA